MKDLVRSVSFARDAEPMLLREWIVTNGLGGYASGTVAGVATRRYHGLLVAALPAPLGRTVMLNHLSERVRLPDRTTVLGLGGEERQNELSLEGAGHLVQLRLERGLPVWRYELDGLVLEKRVVMLHMQNTVHISYRLVKGDGPVRLTLRPALHFRPHEAKVSDPLPRPFVLHAIEDRYELCGEHKQYPPLRMKLHGDVNAFRIEPRVIPDLRYRIEESRGYDARGDLYSPGYFRVDLARDHDATLVVSTEAWETIEALSAEEALAAEHARREALLDKVPAVAREGVAAELVLAADQFVITPAGRIEEAARARAEGDEVRTVIAGYHWFTDWGRDTMISLEGLALSTGRALEAGYILRTFAHYVRDGLIPNMFPEGERDGLYHTADATLWFFHAIDRYLAVTSDRPTLRRILPKLRSIVEHHIKGTRFGIGVDARDGLLRQGAEGYQLTWMDAKVDGWVVTPRRGKAVEINALWYNALRLMQRWLGEEGDADAARAMAEHADRCRASFNTRFWNAKTGHLFDVVDGESGDDRACRPNQVLAISLPHPVLDPARWAPVMDVVEKRLLTPVGLRSLAPGEPDYKPTYDGDLRTRDAAYHQGTVWGWLIGPFVDAWLRVHPEDPKAARRFLTGLADHLGEAAIGSVSEIFDAEAPFTPRGCIAQAWSVAELLRCWMRTEK
jgi:predicted glycogen debranching enzyme